jgi:hypothetical protein
MSAPAHHVETYMRACEIESYEEDGEVYNREKLLVRPHDPIFMKEHAPICFVWYAILHERTTFQNTFST